MRPRPSPRRTNLAIWPRKGGRGDIRVCCRTCCGGEHAATTLSYQLNPSRSSQGPLIPSLSVAFRMLLLMRTVGAMYATIADCDEGTCSSYRGLTVVFNFYEPLHFFQHNGGFQTWELSPEFGIRSWAYVLLHWPMAHILPRLLRFTKVCRTPR